MQVTSHRKGIYWSLSPWVEAYLACLQKKCQSFLRFPVYVAYISFTLSTETNHWSLSLTPLLSCSEVHTLPYMLMLWEPDRSLFLFYFFFLPLSFTVFQCLKTILLSLSCMFAALWPNHGFRSRGALWLGTGAQSCSAPVFAEGLYLLMLKMSFSNCSLRLFQYPHH